MLFDLAHSLFMCFGFLTIIILNIIFYFCVKKEKYKNIILKIFALLTVILHFSSIWVDYFKNGSATVSAEMLLPIYPCHITMWLLFILAFMKNKDSIAFKIIAPFTFYIGIIGGVLGIVLNEAYAGNPNLANYYVLKGLLSHLTMIAGCLYLVVGKFINIRVKNLISCIIGLFFFIIDGYLMIGLYKLANLDCPNAMYLLHPPYSNLPWLNTWTMGFMGLILLFVITMIYEFFALKKEDRWYSKIKDIKSRKKIKGGKNEKNI